VESTNTLAAELANDPRCEPLAILTREQTAGRGQHGRTWTAQPGSSVLLSVLLFPPEFLRGPPVLTAWAAVSVCETVRHFTGAEARIKWPNDVLLSDKKVCGILIEQNRGTVVGIGLNVKQTADDFVRAKLGAASLQQFAAAPLETEHVARALLRVLDDHYALLARGNLSGLEKCWQRRLDLLGRHVVTESHDGTHHGRLVELTFASIKLEKSGSIVVVLRPEMVQHLDAAGSL
jgi:BirA family transcriptional regulator, biotin operon repressor / biotin---[acetyl-CoA-carboxylase] ligase